MTTPDEEGNVASTGRSSAAVPAGEMAGPGSAVIPVPAVTPVSGSQVERAPEVLDGELITEAEYARRTGRRHLPVLAVAAAIRESERTKKITTDVVSRVARSVRVAARAVYTVGQGHLSWVRRALDALTHGPVREQVRLARLAGDREALAEWTERLVTLKDNRAERLRALPATLAAGLRALFVMVCMLAGLLILIGVWLAFTPDSIGWHGWWTLIRHLLTGTLTALTVAIHAVLWAAVPALLVAAWREGRRAAQPPRWLISAQERAEQDAEITADVITAALRHVKIPALTRYLTSGGVLEYVVTPREQGGGTYTQVRLPMGVTAAELLSSTKVELLAGNLGRHRHEVWPQREKDTDARVLDLWIADKGTMDKPAPPWPLLHDGEVDVFRDRLPWGVTMRAEQITVGMLQKHWLIGATSKQGKSTVLRLLALGLALDPTVELHIADLKGDGDWSMFKPRAVTLIEGSTDEHAAATTEMLEWAVGEIARRYDAKRTTGIIGPIPREMSRRTHSGFHPIYLFIDECQVLYGAPHPIGGSKDDARAWRAAKKLHDQARAVNVHLLQATQRPDDRTLPARVREGAHVRCALNVPNHETAKMILADAADRGARPQDLRPGADAGTVVATGEVEDIPQGQAFAIVRTHYVSTTDAYTVIARAMDIIRRTGRTPTGQPTDSEPARDLLVDVQAVMDGSDKLRSTDVLYQLRVRWEPTYGGWSAQQFATALEQRGVEVRKRSLDGQPGQRVVLATDVIAALETSHPRNPADPGEADGEALPTC
jgi:S-DNA-T family DNA segregation ATPase FtsK/SpoIIIE